MAAPASKNIGDLTGKWALNKTYSDPIDPALSLQGIGWLTRKAIGIANITLDVKQYTAAPSPPSTATAEVTHIDISQIATGGLKGTSEKRCLDYEFRDHSDWMFGHVKGQSKFVGHADITDAFLARGWLEDESEQKGPNGESHVLSHVESLDNGWTATQIWGFQTIDGERRHARHIVVAKGSERVEIRLVYDYVS